MNRQIAVLIISVLGASVAAAAQPNIVLLMGDDHGWEETGYHGHPHVKTPVLDEMAATGFVMDGFYAAHPSCSPTRGSFLTGRCRLALVCHDGMAVGACRQSLNRNGRSGGRYGSGSAC